MPDLVTPHGGGALKPLMSAGKSLAAARSRARTLKMRVTFWCYRCGGMASGCTCPHSEKDQLQVSGTQRKWLSEGSAVPPEFSRPEVLEILREHYGGLGERS